MNIIILNQEELTENGRACLSGRRAQHIISVLRRTTGQSVRIGILNGAVGTGVIEDMTSTEIHLNCSFHSAPKPSAGIDLILPMPRPLVMKRLLAPVTSMGIRRIFLTNANKVEKDYFGTHWLSPEHYEPLLIEGLEQSGDTHFPQVNIIRRLKPFVEDRMDELFPTGTRILAHPTHEDDTHSIPQGPAPLVLALGPDGGWTPYETDMFDRNGFVRMSLGSRTLRTDIACIALISVLKHAMHLD
ncbi:16S rRNA (uracil(1498)-N(3))-methyltransferase [Planctomycetota bacterium]